MVLAKSLLLLSYKRSALFILCLSFAISVEIFERLSIKLDMVMWNIDDPPGSILVEHITKSNMPLLSF